jgi:hypothetical protein
VLDLSGNCCTPSFVCRREKKIEKNTGSCRTRFPIPRSQLRGDAITDILVSSQKQVLWSDIRFESEETSKKRSVHAVDIKDALDVSWRAQRFFSRVLQPRELKICVS